MRGDARYRICRNPYSSKYCDHRVSSCFKNVRKQELEDDDEETEPDRSKYGHGG